MDELYNRMIDKDVLKRLQDKFCAVAGIYAMCLDGEGAVLTQMSGEKSDWERLASVVSREQMDSLYGRVTGSSLEDQAVEDTENDAVKYGVVCIKEKGRPVMTWLVCAVLSDADSEEGRNFASEFACQTTLQRLDLALDLLREASGRFIDTKIAMEEALIKSRRNQYSREEMEIVLRRMETTTKVVQMLDSDAPTEEIMMSILGTVGAFLGIDNAYLCIVQQEDSDTVDVIAQWSDEGVSASFKQNMVQPRPAWLCRKKPLVISSSSGRKGYERALKKAGLAAVAVMPVTLSGNNYMYACFEVKGRDHDWNLEDIKLINDSVKVLQSILAKRIQDKACEEKDT